MEVLGIEVVDYTNKSGQRIQGKRLHLGYQKKNCQGIAVLTEFVYDEVASDVKINDFVELLYSKFGKVSRVNIIPSEEVSF